MSVMDWPAMVPLPDRPSTLLELRHASTARPRVVVVPERRFLAIHGAGPRTAADFDVATSVLRAVAELIRTPLPRDRRHVLEVCWELEPALTLEDIEEAVGEPRRRWRQMIELPASVSDVDAISVIDMARRMGGREIPLVRPIHLAEGPAAQLLHVWTDPAPATVRRLYGEVIDAGLRPSGDLHELVVADPLMVGVARGRSIFRIPVAMDSRTGGPTIEDRPGP